MKLADDREEFSAAGLVTGLLMALRLRGYKSIEFGDKTEEAIVHASGPFTEQLASEGYWISYYLGIHPYHGGSGTVREAFCSPSVNLWLQRWIDLDGRFLAEREKLF